MDTSVQKKWYQGWFQFTTRDLVTMGILIAAGGAFQAAWSYLAFQTEILGPLSDIFSSFGFYIVAFLTIYFVPKPGAATIVMVLASIVQLLLGNPYGPIAIFYAATEGIGIDLAYILFKRKISLNMMIVGSLIAWILAAPYDIYRNAVPMSYQPLVVYLGPVIIGKVWVGWLCYLAIVGLRRAGIKGPTQAITLEVLVEPEKKEEPKGVKDPTQTIAVEEGGSRNDMV